MEKLIKVLICIYVGVGEQERLKAIKKTHGSQKLGDVTVDMTIGAILVCPDIDDYDSDG
jgi:hypothetical protein